MYLLIPKKLTIIIWLKHRLLSLLEIQKKLNTLRSISDFQSFIRSLISMNSNPLISEKWSNTKCNKRMQKSEILFLSKMWHSNSRRLDDFLEHLSSFLLLRFPTRPSVDSSIIEIDMLLLDVDMDTMMASILNISPVWCAGLSLIIHEKIIDSDGIGSLSQSDILLSDLSSMKKHTKKSIFRLSHLKK